MESLIPWLIHLVTVYDTPHGVACAMMLPIVMEYNQECTGEKYREIARAMGVKGVDEMSQDEYRKAAIEAVKKLSVDVGIPTKLEAIKEEDLQFLAESAHADACAPGNPKDASVEDLKDLFRKINVNKKTPVRGVLFIIAVMAFALDYNKLFHLIFRKPNGL